MQVVETKFIAKSVKIPVTLTYNKGRIWIKHRFNRTLLNEVRAMDGARWHGYDEPKPIKSWSVNDTPRNDFQIKFLQGHNPYEMWDREPVDIGLVERSLMQHQISMIVQGLTYHYTVLACEMGTGKSLAAIEIMERVGALDGDDAWYIGPVAGVKAVGRELVKWGSPCKPTMMTYEGLVSKLKHWTPDFPAPRVLILDESSKIKTPTSQRSQAVMAVANAVRREYGECGYIIEMSGTPAPKTPVDWWHQCEVACPGYLKEGTIHKLKKSLCILKEEESGITGTTYQKVVTWLDDENKCAKCGMEELMHDLPMDNDYHPFEPSVNEVERLYKRMKGLVLVQFKKDCLDIPEKQYEVLRVKPTVSMLNAAKIIRAKVARAPMVLTLLRELSDGFQYMDKVIGTQKCTNCQGNGAVNAPVPDKDIDTMGPIENITYHDEIVVCDICEGSKVVPKYERVAEEISSPKDEIFINELDEHEDCGRYIVWGGFTGTIDRLVKMCHKYGWSTLRVDGRGYQAQQATGETVSDEDFLDAMDLSNPRRAELSEKYPRICFVGHPQAGGMALTLTASPTELFYSNCFNGEARMQAEDRFHRPGMDKNKGATVKDIICLESDMLVLKNLRLKKKLQDVSMGELETAFTTATKEKKV